MTPSTKKCRSCAKPSKPWALATIVTIALLLTSCTTMQTPVGTETIINDGDTIAVTTMKTVASDPKSEATAMRMYNRQSNDC